ETSLAIAYKHLSEPVPAPSDWAPDVPEKLDRIVLRATAKDPADRPRSAAEMREDLVSVVGSLPAAPKLADLVARTPARDTSEDLWQDRATTVTIPQVLAPGRGHRRTRRRRWPWVILALVLALTAGAWAAWTYAIPHSVSVPRVIGLSMSEARSQLEGAGLKVHVGDPVASIRVPAGDVAKQDPAPGTHIRKGLGVVL